MIELIENILQFEDLPKELSDIKIIHITDMHSHSYGKYEQATNDVLNQHDDADMLILSGDICHQFCIPNLLNDTPADSHPRKIGLSKHGYLAKPATQAAFDVCKKLFDHRNYPLGIYAAQGNHDSDKLMAMLPDLGITTLNNSAVKVKHRSCEFFIAGLRCHSRNSCDIPATISQIEPGKFSIAICHYPELAEPLVAGGINLIFAGHTHGGQICKPNRQPIITHSRTGKYYVSGLTKIDNSYIFTSRGIGTTTVPIRLFCKRQIAVFTLKRK
ncbi:MAG: metallophosphoesterase [Phycisphaerae bacterium]|nr:metallophosphoesterase [Phycisphaerae bacterium]